MSKFKPQYRRLLFVDRKIREGKYPNCTSLAREWETSVRTIQRDMDYLKYELEAPLEYDHGKRGFYYGDPAWFLPSVMLTEGDLLALLIGEQAMAMYCGTPVAKDLSRIYAKLSDLLPEKITLGPDFVQSRFSFFNPPARPIEPKVWHGVLHAVLHHKVLEIDYQSPLSKRAKRHTVHPYHVLNLEGDWYMLAFSERWSDLRQFALSRIMEARQDGKSFSVPAGFDLQATLRTRFGRYLHHDAPKNRTVVRLRFDPALANYISEKCWHPDQKLKKRPGGALELHVPVANTLDMESWILSLGEFVTVVEPPDLAEKIRGRHLAAAHS